MLVEIEGCKTNPSIALCCYGKDRGGSWGVSVAVCQRRQRADGPSYRPDAIPVLWRGEKGGNAKLMARTSGPDMLELWQWIMHLVNGLNRRGIRRTPVNYWCLLIGEH